MRVGFDYSSCYYMRYGIHQGGGGGGGVGGCVSFVVKVHSIYRPLLRELEELEESKVGLRLMDITVNPVGYADDMSTCTFEKRHMERILQIIHGYSHKWCYVHK